MKSALVRAMETPFCLDRVCSCLTVRPSKFPISPLSNAALSLAVSSDLAFACSSMACGGRMQAAPVWTGAEIAARGMSAALAPLAAADLQGPGHHTRAAAVGMGGLRREPAGIEDLAVERATDRTHPLVLHGHPFELLNAHLPVELEPPLVVGAQHLGAGNHLHAVLRLAEHLGTGVPERFRVLHNVAEVADDALDALAGGDAAHHGAPDAIGQFAVDVAGEHQVVLAHEVERVGVDQGEGAGGELVDPLGGEIAVEGQLRVSEVLDAAGDALTEGCPRRLAEAKRLVPAQPHHRLADVGLEFLETFERRQLVVGERAEALVT